MTRCLSLGLGLLLACACAPKAGGQGGPSTEGRYRLGDPGRGWDRVDAGSADRAWHHSGISGALYADSNCGKRFEDGKLEDLTTHLTFGVARGEPERPLGTAAPRCRGADPAPAAPRRADAFSPVVRPLVGGPRGPRAGGQGASPRAEFGDGSFRGAGENLARPRQA